MGTWKEEMLEKEESWARKAERENWKCWRCGGIPVYLDTDFFGTELCDYCRNSLDE